MKQTTMLDHLLHTVDEEVLDKIIVDSFNWLLDRTEDKSVLLNNVNYTKSYSPIRRIVSKKKELTIHWSYKSKELNLRRGHLAIMEYGTNSILLHCRKNDTLVYTLDTLFHEFCHSQQSGYLYAYYVRRKRVNYHEHPLEIEANEFAAKTVPLYWTENSWKFEQK